MLPRGVSETPTKGHPLAHLYYSDGTVFSSVVTVKINNSHHRCKFAFSPWSKYLARLWRGSIHSRCGTTARGPFPVQVPTPSIRGRTSLVQLGEGFSLKPRTEYAPRLHQFTSALWHTVRIDSSCDLSFLVHVE